MVFCKLYFFVMIIFSQSFSDVWGWRGTDDVTCVFLYTPYITGKAAQCFYGLLAVLPQSLEGVSH